MEIKRERKQKEMRTERDERKHKRDGKKKI